MPRHSQLDLFEETHYQAFIAWKALPGSGHVLRDLYALAARYAADWRRTGIPVSMKLIFELERHRIKLVRARAQRAGVRVAKWRGFSLNNNLTAYVAQHIVERRPDWRGLFEHRDSPVRSTRRLAVIVDAPRREIPTFQRRAD